MNGPQDLGGRMGFGPIDPAHGDMIYHAEWEKRAMAMTVACGTMGHWSIDEMRHARESLPPAEYYACTYFEIWAKALEAMLIRHGEVAESEINAGHASASPTGKARVLSAEDMMALVARGGPADRPIQRDAMFAVGDRVRTKNLQPQSHTRLPGYAREKVGVIEAVHGAHVFPDTNAHKRGDNPQWLYTVAFAGQDLWGEDTDPNLVVTIDAWEPYLERDRG